MIKNCPICGKAFDVLYPDIWRYKRNNRFLCSWKCIRLFDGKEEKQVKERVSVKRTRMGRDDMAEAVRMWKANDPGLDQYLTDHGITHICKWKQNARDRYGVAAPATVKVDGPLRIETPETNKVEVVETPEKSRVAMKPVPPPIEYRVTGISTTAGDFRYMKRLGYIDWTTLTGETISMNLEEWKELMKVWPFVLKVLEVEL
jgi:hypothetical protein